MVVSRLLKQWDVLSQYFEEIISKERLVPVDAIHSSLKDPLIKLILIFLDWVLPKFTSLNAFSKVLMLSLLNCTVKLY